MLPAGERPEPTSRNGAGRMLSLIRDGEAVTRADLARRTGLARSTVAQRVEALLARQLVYEAGDSTSTAGDHRDSRLYGGRHEEAPGDGLVRAPIRVWSKTPGFVECPAETLGQRAHQTLPPPLLYFRRWRTVGSTNAHDR